MCMLDMEEIVLQVELGVNPQVGLAQIHEGHDVQDPEGVRLCSFRL
jgi:hypothetical protein